MPADMQKLLKDKDIIVNTIQSRGPSLPIHVARSANLNLLFASAYLSELYGEKKIKMSYMRVGSSPLYFMQGQEAMLENFTEYLNSKEREAFLLLKSSKILDDEKQLPAIRVALQALKDFAHPIKSLSNNQEKLFWKYFLLSDEEAHFLISPGRKKALPNKEKEKTSQKKQELVREIEQPMLPIAQTIQNPQQSAIQPQISKITENIQKIQQSLEHSILDDSKLNSKKEKSIKKKRSPQVDSKFSSTIKEYLAIKDIELLETKEEKKKDFLAKIRLDTVFGKQEYLLIAKDKKKISEDDIIQAIHKAQLEKMPALIIAPGDIDKKHLPLLKEWNNLIKFEKIQ